MRRRMMLVLIALLIVPGAVTAQQATPSASVNPYLQGDGVDILASQKFDENGIAYIGLLDSYFGPVLAVAFRNNAQTPQALGEDISIQARSQNGKLFAVGELDYRGLSPIVVAPNEYAFGIVYFGDAEVTSDLSFTSHVDYEAASKRTPQFFNLAITELNRFSSRIVGTIQNDQSRPANGSWLSVLCFDDSGEPIWFFNDRPIDSMISTGGVAAFQIDIPSHISCKHFVISAFAEPLD